MTLYTVHAPQKPEGVAVDPAELVFVKDGFSWPALLIPPVWLVWGRLWLTLLIWVVAVVVLSILSGFIGTDASTVVTILFAFWFALEANGFRRWTLERRGYVLLGVVEGRTPEAAERRFFGAAEFIDRADPSPAEPPHSAARATTTSQPAPPPRAAPGIVGLFPTPGLRR